MTRKEYIENIIIGTLITDFERYYPEVRWCVTADTMTDRNARIYRSMEDLYKQGIIPNVITLAPTDMEWVVEVSGCYDFDTMRADYNRLQMFSGHPRYTNVSFSQYVNQYLKIVYGKI